MSESQISLKMKAAELLRQRPRLNRVFRQLQMNRPAGKGSANETVARIARTYGRTPEELIRIFEDHLKKAQ